MYEEHAWGALSCLQGSSIKRASAAGHGLQNMTSCFTFYGVKNQPKNTNLHERLAIPAMTFYTHDMWRVVPWDESDMAKQKGGYSCPQNCVPCLIWPRSLKKAEAPVLTLSTVGFFRLQDTGNKNDTHTRSQTGMQTLEREAEWYTDK
jgi:hypothetical protein